MQFPALSGMENDDFGKLFPNAFIGGLHRLNSYETYAYPTQNKLVADMLYNHYSSNGWEVKMVHHADSSFYLLSIQKQYPNYTTGTPLYRQFIQGGKLALYK